jgi:RHS repeat-associated protein
LAVHIDVAVLIVGDFTERHGFGKTGADGTSVVLQLSGLHGDIGLVLPLNTAVAPTVLRTDEYGNARDSVTASARYNWLGAHQRSTKTPNGIVLMGVRLYNPATGRFITVHRVSGGSRTAYEYAAGNPVTTSDLDGRWTRTRYYGWGRVTLKYSWRWSGSTTASAKFVVNKRWTHRVAEYGWYLYTISGALFALAFFFPPAAVISAVVTIAIASIQVMAVWARNRRQCLGFTAYANVHHSWGVPRWASRGPVYPWRYNC